MWRVLIVAVLLALGATEAQARPQIGAWESCRAAAQGLTDCRPLTGFVDPQGREIWLRAPVQGQPVGGPASLYISGAASSEVWFNGVRLGANGQPGATAAAERPGLYDASFPIPDSLWR